MDVSRSITILETLKPVVGLIPVAGGGLAAMLEVAAQVCKAVEAAETNREAYEQLAQDVAVYASVISQAVQSDPRFSPDATTAEKGPDSQRDGLVENIKKLNSVLQEAAEFVQKQQAGVKKRQESTFSKARQLQYDMFHKDEDQKKIAQLRNKIEKSIQSFHVVAHIRSFNTLQKIGMEMEATAADQAQKLEEIQRTQKLEFIERKLSPVWTARFDGSGTPKGCLPRTREKLLKQLDDWIVDRSPSSPKVFLLSGLAGTGKTTIAQSVCIRYDRQTGLVSFFVSRGSTDRRDPEGILRTIGYQLSTQHTAVRTAIEVALRNGRDITTRPLSEQVEGLFTVPLKAREETALPLVIVIDALDECNKVDGREGGNLIPLLATGVLHAPGHVKLLITSREEPKIMSMFKELGVERLESMIRLQHIEDAVVEEDIKTFYKHHLFLIAQRAGFDITVAWPSEADLNMLIKRTGKLFVFAELVVRLLSDERVDPKEQLEYILHSSTSQADDLAFQPLDELYLAVLDKAAKSENPAVIKALERRIPNLTGSLVLLQSPLSTTALAKLLGENVKLTTGDIDHLSAVLSIPEGVTEPVTIFHPSLADFLLKRCTDVRFKISTPDHHAYLAYCCIATMSRHLKRDICDIRDPSVMNEDVENLQDKLDRLLPPEVRYACEYWPVHLANASATNSSLVEDLQVFCENHLLHWVEALSLIGKLSVAHTSLPGAIRWCKEGRGLYNGTTIVLLDDIERTVQAYDSAIRCCALETYRSALLFMPLCKLYEETKDERMGDVELKSERAKSWPYMRRTLEGHNSSVDSIAFSPDGTRIASGSRDKTVRVWDATTGRTLSELTGHTSYVTSVAFSPDGTRIASGSLDFTVRVWDATTGCTLSELTGHTDYVRSVAFSSDGTRITSAAQYKSVCMWDATTGEILFRRIYRQRSIGFRRRDQQEREDISQRVGQDFPASDFDPHSASAQQAANAPSPAPIFEIKDEWLHVRKPAKSSSKSVCWIPPERRGRVWSSNDLVVLGSRSGMVTILSLSRL